VLGLRLTYTSIDFLEETRWECSKMRTRMIYISCSKSKCCKSRKSEVKWSIDFGKMPVFGHDLLDLMLAGPNSLPWWTQISDNAGGMFTRLGGSQFRMTHHLYNHIMDHDTTTVIFIVFYSIYAYFVITSGGLWFKKSSIFHATCVSSTSNPQPFFPEVDSSSRCVDPGLYGEI